TQLEPQATRLRRDRLLGVGDAQVRAAEDVDDVERAGCGDGVGERGKGREAGDLRLVRVDRDTVVASPDEGPEDPERGPRPVRRRADDRDSLRRSKERLDP